MCDSFYSYSVLSHQSPLCLIIQIKLFFFLLDCTIDIAMGFDISERTDEMLISGHNQLKSLLPNIVESVSLVEDLCCLSEPVTTKIAFQVVDRDGSVLYDTDFNVYKREVVEKILTLRVSSPTYFNTALLDSFKNKFKTESNAGVKVRMTPVKILVCVHHKIQYFRVMSVSSSCVLNVCSTGLKK